MAGKSYNFGNTISGSILQIGLWTRRPRRLLSRLDRSLDRKHRRSLYPQHPSCTTIAPPQRTTLLSPLAGFRKPHSRQPRAPRSQSAPCSQRPLTIEAESVVSERSSTTKFARCCGTAIALGFRCFLRTVAVAKEKEERREKELSAMVHLAGLKLAVVNIRIRASSIISAAPFLRWKFSQRDLLSNDCRSVFG